MVGIMKKIPATIITGFLGAGKTSLIKNIMQNAGKRKIALLINEFGDVGVDGNILKACGNENCDESAIIELPNGCICCTVADDFLPAIEKLLAMPEGFDNLIIETSGLALPKPLLKAFAWPSIKSKLTIDGVIAVVDGPAVASGIFAEDLEAIEKQKQELGIMEHDNPLAEVYEDQLLCADLIILNKADQMNDAEIAEVTASIKAEVQKEVAICNASFGNIDADIILGINAAAEDDIDNRKSHHDHEEEHDHNDFETIFVETQSFESVEAVHELAHNLAKTFDILRIKGFVNIKNKPMRYLVQAVGARVSGYFENVSDSVGKLVVISRHGMDKIAIETMIKEASLASVD